MPKFTPSMFSSRNVCFIARVMEVCDSRCGSLLATTNPEFRGITGPSVTCDTCLESLMVEGDSFLENDVHPFLRGKGEEREIFVKLRLC